MRKHINGVPSWDNLRVSVQNRGIGGDTSAGMLSRLYFDVVQQRPDIVIFMGGTNDLWWDLDLNLFRLTLRPWSAKPNTMKSPSNRPSTTHLDWKR